MMGKVLLLLLFSWLPQAYALIEIPKHTSLVIDLAGFLSDREQDYLRASLMEFQSATGPQLQLLTVKSLENEPIESFSIRVADAWKVGQKGKDNGVILIISKEEHRIRIEVGRGLEGEITDAQAGRIIDHAIVPYFKAGNFRDGILNGLNQIALTLGGKLSGAKVSNIQYKELNLSPLQFFLTVVGFLFLMIIVGLINVARRFPSTGYYNYGRHRNYSGWSGWGGGWGGGRSRSRGGFGGGGGGGFSGGGASGNW